MVIPKGNSQRPGFLTLPLTPYNLVPPSPVKLKSLNHVAPFSTICGIQESVSTLLTTVGCPKSPIEAGYGGFALGIALLPSNELRRDVSSPQIYRPALECTYISRLNPVPKILLPRNPEA